MARPWRIQYADAVYHVTSRGNNKSDIFGGESDRVDFIDLLGKSSDRFAVEIFAFCLMDNHYHLFLRTPKANLAATMHWLNATYSSHFLRRHKRSGHFLQGRYKSALVTSEEHWHNLSFYIHLNPVRAGLVRDPSEYEWSSFNDYTRGKARFPWLNRDEVLSQFGGRGVIGRKRYQRECKALIGSNDQAWEPMRKAVFIGLHEEWAKLVEKYKPGGDLRYVSGYRKLARAELNPEHELAKVARIFRAQPEDLKGRRRNFPAKLAAYHHLVENCGASIIQTGKILNVSPMAVSLGMKRLKAKVRNDRSLAEKISRLSR